MARLEDWNVHVDRRSETIILLDGSRIEFRRIQPEDAAALQRFHSRLSERSVYQRFFEFMPRLSDRQAAYFTGADGINRIALVALDPDDPGELIGVVRAEREPGTDRAEYAAVVADRWQGRGVAFGLIRRVVQTARANGITSLYALVLPENAVMLKLLRDLGLPERRRFEDGIEVVELLLDGESE